MVRTRPVVQGNEMYLLLSQRLHDMVLWVPNVSIPCKFESKWYLFISAIVFSDTEKIGYPNRGKFELEGVKHLFYIWRGFTCKEVHFLT